MNSSCVKIYYGKINVMQKYRGKKNKFCEMTSISRKFTYQVLRVNNEREIFVVIYKKIMKTNSWRQNLNKFIVFKLFIKSYFKN